MKHSGKLKAIYEGGSNGQKALRHGNGTYNYLDSDGKTFSYSGEWNEGIKKGGKFTIKNLSEYEGDFDNGEINGIGERKWEDGRKYKGEWKNGEMHGKGIWSNQHEIYEGEFYMNKRQGKGTLTKTINDQVHIYCGEFSSHKFHGLGKYSVENEYVVEGEFNYGTVNGNCKVSWNKIAEFNGQIKEGRLHGIGYYKSSDGSYLYDGYWQDGLPSVGYCTSTKVSLDRSSLPTTAEITTKDKKASAAPPTKKGTAAPEIEFSASVLPGDFLGSVSVDQLSSSVESTSTSNREVMRKISLSMYKADDPSEEKIFFLISPPDLNELAKSYERFPSSHLCYIGSKNLFGSTNNNITPPIQMLRYDSGDILPVSLCANAGLEDVYKLSQSERLVCRFPNPYRSSNKDEDNDNSSHNKKELIFLTDFHVNKHDILSHLKKSKIDSCIDSNFIEISVLSVRSDVSGFTLNLSIPAGEMESYLNSIDESDGNLQNNDNNNNNNNNNYTAILSNCIWNLKYESVSASSSSQLYADGDKDAVVEEKNCSSYCIQINLISCSDLIKADSKLGSGTSDPFVKFTLSNNTATSTVINNSTNPQFNETFEMSWDGSSTSSTSSSILNCEVYDSDVSKSNDFLGNLEINLNELNLFEQPSMHVEESLLNVSQGKIQLEIKLIPLPPSHPADSSSKQGRNTTEKNTTKTFEWLQGGSFDLDRWHSLAIKFSSDQSFDLFVDGSSKINHQKARPETLKDEDAAAGGGGYKAVFDGEFKYVIGGKDFSGWVNTVALFINNDHCNPSIATGCFENHYRNSTESNLTNKNDCNYTQENLSQQVIQKISEGYRYDCSYDLLMCSSNAMIPPKKIRLTDDLPAGVYILEVKDQLDPRVLHADNNSEIPITSSSSSSSSSPNTTTGPGPGEMKGGVKVIRPIPVNKEIKIKVLPIV